MVAQWLFAASLAAAASGFGLTTSENYYTVDTGTDLVFQVRRTDLGDTSTSIGGINSILWKGEEYMETPGRDSHINSGFDWLYLDTTEVSVDAETIGDDIIKITVVGGQLTHYYIVKKGESKIYMGTHWSLMSTVKTGIRYLFRLNAYKVGDGPIEGDVRDPRNESVQLPFIEASDVFGVHDGTTRSKHYTNDRMMDWKYMGSKGDNVGMWVVRATHEGGCGGPFFRSTQIQIRPDTCEITYILNYNHANMEDFRVGSLYQYTYVVNDGEAPDTDIDYTFYKDLNLVGFVGAEGRGAVSCPSVEPRAADRDYVAHIRNEHAQYWAYVNAATGGFDIEGVVPGEYELIVYRVEFEVYKTQRIVVAAGTTTTLEAISIPVDPNDRENIWRIGEWDGTPQELRNGLNVTNMHPSDVRLESWEPDTYVIGVDTPAKFPCYMWKAINNYRYIQFKLTPDQVTQRLVVRIGTTTAYNSARPTVIANTKQMPSLEVGPHPATRSLTTGSYRGLNAMYEYEIPASAWNPADEDQTVIIVLTGGNSNAGFLSPGMSIDAIDLVYYVEPTAAPATYVPTAAPATPVPKTSAPATKAPSTLSPETEAPVVEATLAPAAAATPEPVTASPSTDAAAPAAAAFLQAALLVVAAVALAW
ncbi:putative rhamnogalacturonate lyase A [Diplonema papillatum]|nr:putative rhamnogalacturonate lyase A [Diplonema papillatum]